MRTKVTRRFARDAIGEAIAMGLKKRNKETGLNIKKKHVLRLLDKNLETGDQRPLVPQIVEAILLLESQS